jgi:uncharacterized membrane protein YbhN (UPF0104 family)
MYFALMFAFPLTPSLPLAILTTAVATLGTLVPAAPGYVGVFDFMGRSVLSQFGVPAASALAYILIVHCLTVVPVTLLGFWYAWREGLLGMLAGAAAPSTRTGRSRSPARSEIPTAPVAEGAVR